MVYISELCAECLHIKYILTSVKAGGSCKWVNDSQHLLLEFFDIICAAPSQLYHTALPLSPLSWLHEFYSVELSQEVRVVKGLPNEWDVCFRTVTLGGIPEVIACWKDAIAVGCGTGNIVVLDGITGSQTAVLSGHYYAVTSLTFSLDGRLLVSGSYDETVKLWDVQTGGVIKTFNGHTDYVLSVSISADCTVIASGSKDKTIRLWDIQTKECYQVTEQKEVVNYVSFSPMDSHSFISTSSGTLHQWDINGHQINQNHDSSHVSFSLAHIQLVICQGVAAVVQPFDQAHLSCRCCLFPGGKLVAFTAYGNIYIWDITGSDTNLVKTFTEHTGIISALAFSYPSSLLSSSYGGSLKFWDIGDLLVDPVVTNPTSTPLPSAPIKSITLQAEDGITISGDSNGVVSIWNLSTGHCQASFQTPAKNHHTGAGQLINGRLTYVWYADKNIHIWDTEKGELQIVDSNCGDVLNLRISNDISRVFCLEFTTIIARSILTGEVISKININSHIFQRSLIVDGSRVWVHFYGGKLQGWDFGIPGSPPVQLSTTPPLHPNYTMLLDIEKSTIKNITTGKVVFQLGRRFSWPTDVKWDGQYLVAGYKSGEVLILDFNHLPLSW